MFKISKNFSLNELTKSATATRLDIDNSPSPAHLVPMTALCHIILQPVWEKGGVVSVNSCYRSPDLNAAVRGSSKSQHCKGEAADIECLGGISNDLLATWIVKNLPLDKLILEYFDPSKKSVTDLQKTLYGSDELKEPSLNNKAPSSFCFSISRILFFTSVY